MQPLIEGVMVILLVIGSLVVFKLVNVGIFPVPEFESPIAVLEFVQENNNPFEVVGFVGVPERVI